MLLTAHAGDIDGHKELSRDVKYYLFSKTQKYEWIVWIKKMYNLFWKH